MRSSRAGRVRLPLSVRPRNRERSRECSVVSDSDGPVLHAREMRRAAARGAGCGCVEVAVNPGWLHGKRCGSRCTDAICQSGRSEPCTSCGISVFSTRPMSPVSSRVAPDCPWGQAASRQAAPSCSSLECGRRGSSVLGCPCQSAREAESARGNVVWSLTPVVLCCTRER